MINVERDILLYALRQSLGCDTSSVGRVLHNMLENVDKLTNNDVDMVYRELNHCGKEHMIASLDSKQGEYSNKQTFGKEFVVEEDILYLALQYALGRSTYAPTVVMENITHNKNTLSKEFIHRMTSFIDKSKYFGMEMDRKAWLQFRKEFK